MKLINVSKVWRAMVCPVLIEIKVWGEKEREKSVMFMTIINENASLDGNFSCCF